MAARPPALSAARAARAAPRAAPASAAKAFLCTPLPALARGSAAPANGCRLPPRGRTGWSQPGSGSSHEPPRRLTCAPPPPLVPRFRQLTWKPLPPTEHVTSARSSAPRPFCVPVLERRGREQGVGRGPWGETPCVLQPAGGRLQPTCRPLTRWCFTQAQRIFANLEPKATEPAAPPLQRTIV